jgi:hypothetical protein
VDRDLDIVPVGFIDDGCDFVIGNRLHIAPSGICGHCTDAAGPIRRARRALTRVASAPLRAPLAIVLAPTRLAAAREPEADHTARVLANPCAVSIALSAAETLGFRHFANANVFHAAQRQRAGTNTERYKAAEGLGSGSAAASLRGALLVPGPTFATRFRGTGMPTTTFGTRTLLELYAKEVLCIAGKSASLWRNPLTGSGADGRLSPIV